MLTRTIVRISALTLPVLLMAACAPTVNSVVPTVPAAKTVVTPQVAPTAIPVAGPSAPVSSAAPVLAPHLALTVTIPDAAITKMRAPAGLATKAWHVLAGTGDLTAADVGQWQILINGKPMAAADCQFLSAGWDANGLFAVKLNLTSLPTATNMRVELFNAAQTFHLVTALPVSAGGIATADLSATSTAKALLADQLTALGKAGQVIPPEAVTALASRVSAALATSTGDPLTIGDIVTATNSLAAAVLAGKTGSDLTNLLPAVVAPSGGGGGGGGGSVVNTTPTLTAVSPAYGRNTGTTTITLTGTNFTGTPTVTIGSTPATGVTVNSSTQLTATVSAALTAGAYDVNVAVTGQTTVTLTGGYRSLDGTAVTFAGTGGRYSAAQEGGQATAVGMYRPYAIAKDTSGNIYVAARDDARIFKITPAGITTTFAGNGNTTYSAADDGGPATAAAIGNPTAMAIDGLGNLYVADYTNKRIRKIVLSTATITTVAGAGSTGYSAAEDGGPATAAHLGKTYGLACDAANNLYASDYDQQRVFKIAKATGTITSIAGTGVGGYSAAEDGGPATSARLNGPNGVVLDTAGNLYIAEGLNSRIRKVAAGTGTISTIAGNGNWGYAATDDGSQATAVPMLEVAGLTCDPAGYLYEAEGGSSNIIRRIDLTTGTISTWAAATNAVYGLLLLPDGRLYYTSAQHSNVTLVQ